MKSDLIERRVARLKEQICNKNEAILLTNEVNIGYFCGFMHSEGYLLITMTKTFLFVDFRYYEAAKRYAIGCEVICFSKLFSDIYETLCSLSVNSLYFEAADITLSKYFQFKKFFNANSVECLSSDIVDNRISDIRSIKDETELIYIQRAQQITEEAYLEVLNYLKPGVTERRIAIELEYLIKLKGGSDISFDLITITGKKTACPHGVPGDDMVCEGDFFTFDIGSIYNAYHSDTTRTVAVKYADEEMKKVYDIVLKAQLKALSVIKAGVKCSDVDKAARDVIDMAGYGKYFGHATGHGVGLDIHEAPAVSLKNDAVLQSGMVITDEPGIYLPDKFGVRIEDMVCVTEEDYKNLVSLPKELIIV